VDFQTQYQIVWLMLLTGIFLSAVFEVYRHFHKRYKFRKLILHFLDSCFWIMAALLVFYVLYTRASGELRIYYFLFVIAGAITHHLLLRQITMNVTHVFIYIISTIVRSVKSIVKILIVNPLMFILEIGKKIWNLIFLAITALVGVTLGVLHWISSRCKIFFRKK